MENIVSKNFNEMEKILHEFNTEENLAKIELVGRIMVKAFRTEVR